MLVEIIKTTKSNISRSDKIIKFLENENRLKDYSDISLNYDYNDIKNILISMKRYAESLLANINIYYDKPRLIIIEINNISNNDIALIRNHFVNNDLTAEHTNFSIPGGEFYIFDKLNTIHVTDDYTYYKMIPLVNEISNLASNMHSRINLLMNEKEMIFEIIIDTKKNNCQIRISYDIMTDSLIIRYTNYANIDDKIILSFNNPKSMTIADIIRDISQQGYFK